MKQGWELWIDWARGLATDEEKRRVELEAAANPELAARLSRWQRVAASHEPVDPWTLQRLFAIVPEHPAPAKAGATVRLVFDNLATSGAGLRQSANLARELQFESGFGRLSLRFERSENLAVEVVVGFWETGSDEVFAALMAELWRADEMITRVAVGESGDFELENLTQAPADALVLRDPIRDLTVRFEIPSGENAP